MILREARHILTALMVAALCAVTAVERVAAQDPERVREATREVFGSAEYEVDGRFDTTIGDTESPLEGRRGREVEWRRETTAPPDQRWDFGSDLFSALGWIVLGTALAFLLIWVVRALLAGPLPDSDRPRARARKVEAAEPSSGGAVPEWDPGQLAEAEAAAARGDFDAAVHILWLATLGPIAELMGRPLAVDETSREILREAPLPSEHRPSLELLVGTVERSLFGGRATEGSGYRRAREAFCALTGVSPRRDA